ncbi:MAG: alpha-1,4-glucan--maltose-1-phosphate maltosyltransferase [Micromonosporaceae bacterium]
MSPLVACGEHPAKAVVGERVPISATVYREGHEAIGCGVAWRGPDAETVDALLREGETVDALLRDDTDRSFTRMITPTPGTDRWQTEIIPDRIGLWTFVIEAWADPYLTWAYAAQKKLEAGQGADELHNDLVTAAQVLEEAAGNPATATDLTATERQRLRAAASTLRDPRRDLHQRVSAALRLRDLMWRHPVRRLPSRSPPCQIWVDRPLALFGAWYEFFPRSEPDPMRQAEVARGAAIPSNTAISPNTAATSSRAGQPVHGTFRSAAKRLDAIAEMGFDIVYLPPIHPIGKVNRKGRDNALVAGPDDVGSPWAIGSAEGGHDAIHPQLGDSADFKAFVTHAEQLGMEVALDLALQAAPDHPWVAEHPEWFTTQPDGSIAYAENPPKKYQDIYPINFDNDPEGIYAEVLRVVRHWIDHGVKIFRVDNPHTKPLTFWRKLIDELRHEHPDVILLAEAFTRPALMHGLAKIGFSQSYTYFTWRNGKQELIDYCLELVDALDYMRPNFWVNTPDILHRELQRGEPAMFKIRAVLASLLAPSWGVYSGYELYEHQARPGAEEYLDNEKYQLRPRDWDAASRQGRSLAPYLTRLNQIRRRNPALAWMRNLRFHEIDNDALLCWSKRSPGEAAGGEDNTVLVVCTLDPRNVQWGNTSLNMPAIGFDWHERFAVRDEITGASHDWGEHNTVRLDPHQEPAHVFTVYRHA